MGLILVILVPVLVIFSIKLIVDKVNPTFDSDNYFVAYRLPRILLAFALLVIVGVITYLFS